MPYGYNSQGQIMWVDQPGGTAFDTHSGQSHQMQTGSTPIIAYGPNRNITPGVGWIDPATQKRPPQSSEELGAIYDRSPGGTPEGRAKFIAGMQAADLKAQQDRAPTQDTSGSIWNIIRGHLPPGKKYDSQGNIVNTTKWEKFDTGLGNAAAYGGAGLGIAAGGLALGALAAGAYGAGAAGGGAAAGGAGGGAAGGGAAAAGAGGTLGAASTPALIGAGTTAVPGTIVGSGATLGAGFGGAGSAAAAAGAAGSGSGAAGGTLANTAAHGFGGVQAINAPATVAGGGSSVGGGTLANAAAHGFGGNQAINAPATVHGAGMAAAGGHAMTGTYVNALANVIATMYANRQTSAEKAQAAALDQERLYLAYQQAKEKAMDPVHDALIRMAMGMMPTYSQNLFTNYNGLPGVSAPNPNAQYSAPGIGGGGYGGAPSPRTATGPSLGTATQRPY